MKKKSIQIYVTKEGKEAALKLTKEKKKEFGTQVRQCEVVSDILIYHSDIKKNLLNDIISKVYDKYWEGYNSIQIIDFLIELSHEKD